MTTIPCALAAAFRIVARAALAVFLAGGAVRVVGETADLTLVLVPAQPPHLRITGRPFDICQVQWSDDLADPGRWFHLTHCILTNGTAEIMDATATNATVRYYRAVHVPNLDMVLIPGGSFQMGDSLNEGNSDELPVHTVRVSAFYMDRTEVSKARWDEVRIWATNAGYAFSAPGNGKDWNHPVHSVSWHDALKWCNARSEREGLTPCYYADTNLTVVYRTAHDATNMPSVRWTANGYRLPTEAEWERAARAGLNGHRFPWHEADTITHNQANYYSLSSPELPYDISSPRGYHPTYRTGGFPYTSPCGAFPANAYGLFDMAGNVREWCWDTYDANWYSQPGATLDDPRGPPASAATRVTRGGGWRDNANYQRCADRLDENPFNTLNVLGFRCVRRP